MLTTFRPGRRAATVALALSLVAAVQVTAEATPQAGTDCATVDEVIAVQMPGTSVLSGRVYTPNYPLFAGRMSTLDGSQTVPMDSIGQFELPLGARSGEWYVSYLLTSDCEAWLPPVEPNLVKVRNTTRITPTTPDQYVPYGQQITVAGVLEGWTQAAGWQRLAARPLDVWRQWYDASPVKVSTDTAGAYTATVTALEVAAAGTAHFAGDDTWLRADGGSFVQVHARISADVNDTSPAVGQRVRVTGQVAPGNIPVRLEELRDGSWTTVAGPVTADADGTYVLRYRPTLAGTRQLRAWTDGTNTSGTLEGVYGYTREFTVHVHR
jgi:hypothetical protein